MDNEIARLTVKEYLKNFKNIDSLILGCTHYPLYENIIKELLPGVETINTGKVVAKYIENRNKIDKKCLNVKEDEFYLTDTECNFIDVATKILQSKIDIKSLDR